MTDERTTTIIYYVIASCPKCNKAHCLKLKGYLQQQKVIEKVPMFGGPGEDEEAEERTIELLFTCPITKKKFTHSVPEVEGVEVIGLASEEDIALVANLASKPSHDNSEFEEWTKKSRETALDFCKMMLSTSTGGIPLYFGILKYIGFEKIGNTVLSKFAILPPMLFLAAAILYVIASRPQYELVALNDFNNFRMKRLKRLNHFIIGGTAIFSWAVGLAIAILFYALSK